MKPKRAKPIKAMEIEWMPDCRLAVGFVHDRYNPVGGWLQDTVIGLRSDGVIVWRKAKELKR